MVIGFRVTIPRGARRDSGTAFDEKERQEFRVFVRYDEVVDGIPKS